MIPRFALSLSALALLSPLAASQIPAGHGVRFSATNGAAGVEFIDLSGGAIPIPVSGLVGPRGYDSGAIDPLTGDLFLGGHIDSANGGKLLRMGLTGTAVAMLITVVDTGSGKNIRGVALDQAGDIFMLDEATIWKVDRATSTATVWDTNTYLEDFNTLEIDPATDRMWVGTSGFFGEILEYDLSAGPGTASVLLNLDSRSLPSVSGISFDGSNKLYCSAFGTPVAFEYDFSTGLTAAVAGVPGHGLNHLFFDQQTALLHTCGSSPDTSWDAIDVGASLFVEIVPPIGSCGPFTPCPLITGVAVPPPAPKAISFCNGDGGNQMGCTNCPCNNNALPGSLGGCLNSAGTSAALVSSGNPSVSLAPNIASDLRFGLGGAPPNAFCILNSGDAVAPGNMANPCFGMNSGSPAAAFDGLRCAIMNTRRHGGRSADANGSVGVTNSPWGGSGGPPIGIAQAGGGFVSGQTRYFQVINRDDPMTICMRGLNTSQAIEVTFTP